MKKILISIILLSIVIMSCSVIGSKATPTSGLVIPQNTGPARITGEFSYTNDIIEVYYVEQAVALLDMTGFIMRDEEWELPVDSQVLGYLDLDEDNNTGTFSLSLPVFPEGELNDVDQDAAAEKGVQVFVVGYNPNLTGGPFSEGDDRSRGWPSYLTSVVTDSENDDEVIGGMMVIWSPDDSQSFPSGFGDDGLLFTSDDPVMDLGAGYSIINLDESPFEVIRDTEITMTLHEPADIAVKDFSSLSYTKAFDQMFEIVRKEYAFNGVNGKQPDWDKLYDQVAPLVKDAEKQRDDVAFYMALQEFVNAFNDGHVGLSGDVGQMLFYQQAVGGIGAAVRELDDGRVLVVYILEGSPAQQAGIQVGDEITEVNGKPASAALDDVKPLFGPYSTDFGFRYDQAIFLLRGPSGTSITLTYKDGANTGKIGRASCRERL